tara:strand:+ start:290 stop:997 length:708 start_codon:yes stop_codon:yes gene_type:complete
MPHPVKLDTKTFSSKKEATEFFKQMLHRYDAGDRINKSDSEHLNALLKRHEEYKQKIGAGVSHFELMSADYGTNCFRIERIDGTGTDFSYLHCIRNKPKAKKQEVMRGLREVVRYDLYRAKEKYFKENMDENRTVECAVTRERVTKTECHMDHASPKTFEMIVEFFLDHKNMNYNDVEISTGRDNQLTPEIMNSKLAEDFKTYHHKNAAVRVVKAEVNLSQATPNRIKKGQLTLF